MKDKKTITLFSGKVNELRKLACYSLDRNRELIFIESLEELKNRIGYKSPYNLVRKASILRFLVIDNYVSKTINKNYNLNFEYKYELKELNQTITNLHKSVLTYTKMNIIPSDKAPARSINKFLNEKVLCISDNYIDKFVDKGKNHLEREYSIQKIIKLLANGHGGVHFQDWNEIDKNHVFSEESSPLNINFNSVLHDIIDEVSTVLLKAYNNLVYSIENKDPVELEIIIKKYL